MCVTFHFVVTGLKFTMPVYFNTDCFNIEIVLELCIALQGTVNIHCSCVVCSIYSKHSWIFYIWTKIKESLISENFAPCVFSIASRKASHKTS